MENKTYEDYIKEGFDETDVMIVALFDKAIETLDLPSGDSSAGIELISTFMHMYHIENSQARAVKIFRIFVEGLNRGLDIFEDRKTFQN